MLFINIHQLDQQIPFRVPGRFTDRTGGVVRIASGLERIDVTIDLAFGLVTKRTANAKGPVGKAVG